MYDILPELYQKVLAEILDSVGNRGYYSGRLELEHEGVTCVMSLSAVIYRSEERYPEGLVQRIVDMVPVWWEFHTFLDGDELLNDFSFNYLRQYL